MPVLLIEMPAKLEFLLYRRMFLNIKRIFNGFFLIRVGPVFQAQAGTITNFIFLCSLIVSFCTHEFYR